MRYDLRARAQRGAGRAIVEGGPMGSETVFRIRALLQDPRDPRNGPHRPRGGPQDEKLRHEYRRVRSYPEARGRCQAWRHEDEPRRDMARSRLHHRPHAAHTANQKYEPFKHREIKN